MCRTTSIRSRILSRFVLIVSLHFGYPALVFAGPIYVYKEADGVTRFSSKKPPEGVRARVFTAKSSKFSWYRSNSGAIVPKSQLFLTKYSEIVKQAAKSHGLNEGLIRAVIHAESAFNPRAVSHKGALGLMQLMPSNLRPYGVKDPFSPQQNIHGGSKLLSRLLRKYDGDVKLALAAYNAGEGAVEKYKGIPPYSETQKYVRRVIELQQRYSSRLYG